MGLRVCSCRAAGGLQVQDRWNLWTHVSEKIGTGIVHAPDECIHLPLSETINPIFSPAPLTLQQCVVSCFCHGLVRGCLKGCQAGIGGCWLQLVKKCLSGATGVLAKSGRASLRFQL